MRRRVVTLAIIAVFAGLAPAWSQPAPSQPSTTQIGIALMERPATAVPRGAALRAVKILADWSVIEAQRGAPIWGDLDRAVVLAEQWQWVDVKDGWISYSIRLTDATFANTWGWDFAINAAGNRSEDPVVRSVTVRKGGP